MQNRMAFSLRLSPNSVKSSGEERLDAEVTIFATASRCCVGLTDNLGAVPQGSLKGGFLRHTFVIASLLLLALRLLPSLHLQERMSFQFRCKLATEWGLYGTLILGLSLFPLINSNLYRRG